jgi:hypothetical protein
MSRARPRPSSPAALSGGGRGLRFRLLPASTYAVAAPPRAFVTGWYRPVSSRPKAHARAARRAPQKPAQAAAAPQTPWAELLRPWHLALAFAALHLALALLSLVPTPHDGGDNAAYLALARSLQDGSYRELWDPAMRPHTQYPPGWPMIVAAALTLGLKPWLGFKVVVSLFSALAVALAYLWARRVSTPAVAAAVGFLLAIGPGVIDVATWELSDPPFWAFSMLALWAFAALDRPSSPEAPAAEAADPDRSRWRAGLGMVALASVATLLAYATRSAAVPLVVAAGAWMAWKRRWAWLAAFAVIVGAYAVPWWLRGKAHGAPGYASHLWYVDPYRPSLGTVGIDGMLSRMLGNASRYAGEHLPFLLTGRQETGPALLLGIVVLGLAAAGWVLRARRRLGLAEIWLPLYLGLVLIWPREWSAERFILPALPMLLVCAAEPVRALGARMGRPALAGSILVALLALTAAAPLGRSMQNSAGCRAIYGPEERHPCLIPEWDDFLDLAASLRGRLPEGSAVLSRKPTLFWAYSGYPSRVYPFTADPDSLLRVANQARARYVLLDYMDQVVLMYLAPVLMQRPQGFCVMDAVGPGRATLMAILPGAETMANVRDRPGNETVNVPFPRCPRSYWAPGKAPPDAPEQLVRPSVGPAAQP